MNTKLTPMNILKAHFSNLEKNVENMINTKTLNIKELSKGGPHYNPHGENSRGVKSDFIRIYQDKTKVVGKKRNKTDYDYGYSEYNEYNSFAFVFNYLEVDEPYIIVTLKNNGKKYISSPSYCIEEMKALMRSFNKEINKQAIDTPNKLFALVHSIFIPDNGVDEEELVKNVVSEINNHFDDLNKEIKKQQKNHNSTKIMYINSVSQYENEVNESEEFKKVTELKKQLREAETELSKKESELKKKYCIKSKKSHLKDAKSSFDTLNSKKENELTKMIKKYPFHLREDILERIS